MLILTAVALLTAIGVVTADAPVVAREAAPDNAPRGERVAGRTYNTGSSFGPVMFGVGYEINVNFFMFVVGIRDNV